MLSTQQARVAMSCQGCCVNAILLPTAEVPHREHVTITTPRYCQVWGTACPALVLAASPAPASCPGHALLTCPCSHGSPAWVSSSPNPTHPDDHFTCHLHKPWDYLETVVAAAQREHT